MSQFIKKQISPWRNSKWKKPAGTCKKREDKNKKNGKGKIVQEGREKLSLVFQVSDVRAMCYFDVMLQLRPSARCLFAWAAVIDTPVFTVRWQHSLGSSYQKPSILMSCIAWDLDAEVRCQGSAIAYSCRQCSAGAPRALLCGSQSIDEDALLHRSFESAAVGSETHMSTCLDSSFKLFPLQPQLLQEKSMNRLTETVFRWICTFMEHGFITGFESWKVPDQ